jgi:hypothetical protein
MPARAAPKTQANTAKLIARELIGIQPKNRAPLALVTVPKNECLSYRYSEDEVASLLRFEAIAVKPVMVKPVSTFTRFRESLRRLDRLIRQDVAYGPSRCCWSATSCYPAWERSANNLRYGR